MEKITDRLSKYMDYKGLNANKITNDAGLSVGLIGKSLKNQSGFNSDTIEKILRSYPDINPVWFVLGEGDMIKRKVNDTLYNENIRKSIRFSEDTKNKENLIVSNQLDGIPLIPIEAMAGFGLGSTQVMDYDTERYNVPEFTELKVDFMIRVKGSSMYPKYNSGDIVACKKLSLQDAFFQWNKVYVLDTEQGALIKRIKRSEKEDHVLIVSDNLDYDSFDLHLSKINAIAIVVGVIRLE